MPASYRIDEDLELVIVTLEGELKDDHLLALQKDLAADLCLKANFNELIDGSQIGDNQVTPICVRQLAEANLFSKQSRCALVANSELSYGLARMYEMLRAPEGSAEICVYRDLDLACEWLGISPQCRLKRERQRENTGSTTSNAIAVSD
jgi:hypothetical protein